MRLDPAVAATRAAVSQCVTDLALGALVVVAASGGADSTALAAAAAFHCRRGRLRVGLITVDHGLQAGSAQRARALANWARGVGFDPVEAVRVRVRYASSGPEAAARQARYAALEEFSRRTGGAPVLLGHTLDDQAETVLMRLARGSGARALAGMPAVRGPYRRPFLALPRAVTQAACAAQGLHVWSDPHNADPAYTRARVRTQLLPTLVEVLGPGALGGLARTASLLRADEEALELWTNQALSDPQALTVAQLEKLPLAVRSRVLRRSALDAGAPGGALNADHLAAVDRLVTQWHGQGPVSLPGRVLADRACGRLRFYVSAGPSSTSGHRGGAGVGNEHPAAPR